MVVYRIRYGDVGGGYTMYNIMAEDDSHGDGQTNFYGGGDVGDGYIIRRVQLYIYIHTTVYIMYIYIFYIIYNNNNTRVVCTYIWYNSIYAYVVYIYR